MDRAISKIVKENNKYYIFSKDGSKKLGGPFESKEQAVKRLRQIEYFANKGSKMNLENVFHSFGEKFLPTDISRPKNGGNEGAPDLKKAAQKIDINLSENPTEPKLIGTIAGQE